MKKLTKNIQAHFDKMCETGKLFRVDMSGDKIWELYLASFTPDADPVFRDPASTTHNCNLCKNFIRRYGNIVSISEDYSITTIFDVEAKDEFVPVVEKLRAAITKAKITEVFFESFDSLNKLPYESCKKTNSVFQLGIAKNVKQYNKEEAEKFGVVKPEEIRTFDHMNLSIPKLFVDISGKSIETIMGEFRDSKNVFQRAMETISLDTLELVKDLIIQGSLLDGTTHLYKIEQIIPLKREYDSLPAKFRDNWCWTKSYRLPFAKFKNELIGVLCSELSEGEEINKACQSWNKRVDPVNYMKTTAPITKKQIAEAQEFVESNGYVESFDRRFANMDDIKASEILHVNIGKDEIKSVSMFDGVKASSSSRHKRNEFDGVEEVSIDKFMKDILPGCTSIEAFLTNQHEQNMMSLTTANKPDSKPIFKWNNNYSWTFNGNLAGKSQIKETVASKGGKVDGILRFSGVWNDTTPHTDHSDLDLWCQQPDGDRIGFSTGYRKDTGNHFSSCRGQLDIDDRGYANSIHAENIYFDTLSKMKDGKYNFWVHQYSANNSKGFKAEIEFDGEIYNYEYNQPVSGNIKVADVTLKNGVFSITHHLPETTSSREIYGLETNQFHKVNLLCLSPNHWDGNNTGNKHYFFMLDKCKSPVSIRSFHNENLIPELAAHRKVIEVLGSTNMITANGKYLSGLGFNATVKDELLVRLSGTHKRMLKIKF